MDTSKRKPTPTKVNYAHLALETHVLYSQHMSSVRCTLPGIGAMASDRNTCLAQQNRMCSKYNMFPFIDKYTMRLKEGFRDRKTRLVIERYVPKSHYVVCDGTTYRTVFKLVL